MAHLPCRPTCPHLHSTSTTRRSCNHTRKRSYRSRSFTLSAITPQGHVVLIVTSQISATNDNGQGKVYFPGRLKTASLIAIIIRSRRALAKPLSNWRRRHPGCSDLERTTVPVPASAIHQTSSAMAASSLDSSGDWTCNVFMGATLVRVDAKAVQANCFVSKSYVM